MMFIDQSAAAEINSIIPCTVKRLEDKDCVFQLSLKRIDVVSDVAYAGIIYW